MRDLDVVSFDHRPKILYYYIILNCRILYCHSAGDGAA